MSHCSVPTLIGIKDDIQVSCMSEASFQRNHWIIFILFIILVHYLYRRNIGRIISTPRTSCASTWQSFVYFVVCCGGKSSYFFSPPLKSILSH